MSKYKKIPITAAKEIASKYAKDQVIILTWDKAHSKTHITTFGKSLEDCQQAAAGGNNLKRALGWPDELCQDMPKRASKGLIKQVRETLKAGPKKVQDIATEIAAPIEGVSRIIRTLVNTGEAKVLPDWTIKL